MLSTKTQIAERRVVLNPAGLGKSLTETFSIGGDLKRLMNLTQGKLRVDYGPSGLEKMSLITSEGNKLIGNQGHVEALAGARRMVYGAIKEAEKTGADHEKLYLLNQVIKEEKITPPKYGPAALGRLSDLVRYAKHLKENVENIDDMEDDEAYGDVLLPYLKQTAMDVSDLVVDEAKELAKNGKPEKGWLEAQLEKRCILKWSYNKLTQKNAVPGSMTDPRDFFFPANNITGGVSFRRIEITEDFLKLHSAVAAGNEFYLNMMENFMADLELPKSSDSKDIVESRLDNFEINLSPGWTREQLIERYLTANVKETNISYPTLNEAKYLLEDHLPKLHSLNISWNKFQRFAMTEKLDISQFWAYHIKPSVITNWEVTESNPVKSHIRDVNPDDFIPCAKGVMYDQAMSYCFAKIGIYNYAYRELVINKVVYPSSYSSIFQRHEDAEVHNAKKIGMEQAWKAWKKSHDSINDTDVDAIAASKKIEPILIEALTWDTIDPFHSDAHGQFCPRYPTKDEASANLANNFVHDHKDLENYFYLESPKLDLGADIIKKFKSSFRKKSQDTKPQTASIIQPLTDESKKYVDMLDKNVAYGQAIKATVINWLTTSFTGAIELQAIGARSVYDGLISQEFYEESDE